MMRTYLPTPEICLVFDAMSQRPRGAMTRAARSARTYTGRQIGGRTSLSCDKNL